MKTYLLALVAIGLMSCKQAAPKEKKKSPESPTTFVLVHSAWLGSWQWSAVKKEIENAGHRVIAPDLPGHGNSTIPAGDITMEDYVQTLTQILDSQTEEVVLVGHSFNGITVSRVAELRPYKVKSIVYLTAFLLPQGGSFFKAVKGVEGSLAVENFYLSEDQTQALVKEDKIHEAFAHDTPLETFNQVASKIVPEPAAPLSYELEVSEERWGKIPKYYIECTEDRAISISVQRSMYEGRVVKSFSLKSSHTPNFSMPDQLAKILLEIAAQ